MKISMAAAMVWTLLIGTGVAALLHASAIWAAVMSAVVSTLLLVAILGAIYRTGSSRAACVGFLVLGWGYVILSVCDGKLLKGALVNPSTVVSRVLLKLNLTRMIPIVPGQEADLDSRSPNSEPHYETVTVLKEVGPSMYDVQTQNGVTFRYGRSRLRTDNTEFYLAVGNSLANLLFAFAGAAIARWLYLTRPSRAEGGDSRPMDSEAHTMSAEMRDLP